MSALKMLKKLGGSKRDRAATTDGAKKSDDSSAPPPNNMAPKPFKVQHYEVTETTPFPELMDDDFPKEKYRSRHGEVKTACHWGQRKLLLSEIQLLSQYCKQDLSYLIVYAGSAPGTHLAFLDKMFGRRHQWELVDPGSFDVPVLGPLPNFRLRNEFCTNWTAYELCARRIAGQPSGLNGCNNTIPHRYALRSVFELITIDDPELEKQAKAKKLQESLASDLGQKDVARGTHDIPSMYEEPVKIPHGLHALFDVAMERVPTLFISDIRSGSLAHDNFEEHVAENMKAQQCWTEIIQPDWSLLKFRLPYTIKHATGVVADGTSDPAASSKTAVSAIEKGLADANGCVNYLRGDMIIPIWTRPTSTEGRLCAPRGAFQVPYNIADYEDQCFFLNGKLREVYHFNHILAPHVELDNHFDAAAEVHAITKYVVFMNPELEGWESDAAKKAAVVEKVKSVCESITKEIKCTFEGAIRRRDKLIMFQAANGLTVSDIYDDEAVGMAKENLRGGTAATTSTSDGVSGQGSVKSWEGEAKRLIDAAAKERSRLLWNRNYGVVGDEPKGEEWRTVLMPQ